jgi:hypothetical protein
VASALGNEAGWAAFDHGDQQLARFLYTEAQLLAASSGSIELQTLQWITMSMQKWGWRKVAQLRPGWPDAPLFDVLILPLRPAQ